MDAEIMERFTVCGIKAVSFRMIRDLIDLDDKTIDFKPSMCHQIFGPSEKIFGYEGLDIYLLYIASTLKVCLLIKYNSKWESTKDEEKLVADDIIQSLESVMPLDYMTNLDNFASILENHEKIFKPFGHLIKNFTRNIPFNKFDKDKTKSAAVEVYFVDHLTPKFIEYFTHVESFAKWFIDAASQLDTDDERWKFFMMYEKYHTNGRPAYAFMGYAAVYEFYCYPDKIRPRVSQMLILPPYQKCGLGIEMMEAIYEKYRPNPSVLEITVEAPSDSFEFLRDFVDARDCAKLPSFQNEALKNEFTDEMKNDATKNLKLTQMQARRAYEILRLKAIERHSPEFELFKELVNARLNIPYLKQKAVYDRLMKKNIKDPKFELMQCVDAYTRADQISNNFQQILGHYDEVISRLNEFVE